MNLVLMVLFGAVGMGLFVPRLGRWQWFFLALWVVFSVTLFYFKNR